MIYELKLERRRALGLVARVLGSLSLLIFFVIFAAIALAGPSDLLSQVISGILAVVFLVIPILLVILDSFAKRVFRPPRFSVSI